MENKKPARDNLKVKDVPTLPVRRLLQSRTKENIPDTNELKASNTKDFKVPALPVRRPLQSSTKENIPDTNKLKVSNCENKKPADDCFKVPTLPVPRPLQSSSKGKSLKSAPVKKICWTPTDFDFGPALGKGKFGEVYQAREKKSKYVVALKVLCKRMIKDSQIEHLVRREVEIQKEMRHPNILRLYGFFDDKDHIYLILEYAKQGSLFGLLQQRGRFDENTASIYIRDLTKALIYCHGKKVIHRDLKPENILIGPNGEPKIADFGWSVRSTSSKRMTICGTLDYLTPEMLTRKPHNYGVDIWGLGVLCYELLVGLPPFARKEPKQRYLKIMQVIIEYPEYVSEKAKDLMGKLLVVNPENRLPLAGVLEHPWIVENAPPGAQPPASNPDPNVNKQ
ncbi:uncharacterized protein LOC134754099 [Cydia strobilella]|uniref:uncharacterized protein LOC134754099 n=1 Tax=Cydia strobilella TaxID=1100964 RepID=UPI003003C3DB